MLWFMCALICSLPGIFQCSFGNRHPKIGILRDHKHQSGFYSLYESLIFYIAGNAGNNACHFLDLNCFSSLDALLG